MRHTIYSFALIQFKALLVPAKTQPPPRRKDNLARHEIIIRATSDTNLLFINWQIPPVRKDENISINPDCLGRSHSAKQQQQKQTETVHFN